MYSPHECTEDLQKDEIQEEMTTAQELGEIALSSQYLNVKYSSVLLLHKKKKNQLSEIHNVEVSPIILIITHVQRP